MPEPVAKYFAFIDGEQKGPLELRQLISAGVRPSTYVWTKGMDDWHRADEVPDICRLLRQHLAEKKHPTNEVNTEAMDKPPVGMTGFQSDSAHQEERPLRFPIRENQIPEPDYNIPPQVSMTLAVITLILCFPPSGIAAVVFTHKARKKWEEAIRGGDSEEAEQLKRQAHEFARLSKMWLGLTVALGIIFWTLVFSVKQ